MKNVWGIIFLLVILTILGFVGFTFQVRQTESALVTCFGNPVRSITEPGLYFRWPIPIHRVHRFDSRSRLLEVQMQETATAGGEPIIIVSYLIWRIGDPLRFLTSVQDIDGAQEKLRVQLQNAANTVVGRHPFSDFVNTDPSKLRFEEIEQEITAALQQQAAANYGVDVRLAGIKRLMVPEKVTQDVFERMKADRKVKTDTIVAAGNAEADRIRSEAEAKQKELLAVAESRAQAIRGAGDAEAARYYKELEADPELAMFLRDLESLKRILKERTTLVLGTDVEPFSLLKKRPSLETKQP
ncbi:MAG: protease modulator HflC [Anaerohalosphaeraceae bacterium]